MKRVIFTYEEVETAVGKNVDLVKEQYKKKWRDSKRSEGGSVSASGVCLVIYNYGNILYASFL